MVESEDEFAELCSKLLKRVKKSKPLEGQSTSTASTAAKNRSKRPKQSGAKNKASNGASKEAEESDKAGGVPEKPNDGSGAEQSCAVPVPQSSRHTEIDVHAKESQEETTNPAEQPSVKDCVLGRMRQFKRTSPIRMKLNSVEIHEKHIKTLKVNSDVHVDGDLAMALQMDLKEQQPVSLEDEGLFFCQLCQKDLTSMSSTLREQHVNRCLDQVEGVQSNAAVPAVPSCPLCGKPFTTEKSRSSHLKRCAAKLEVPAQTLLHAVQRQAAEMGTEVPERMANVKRKGAPKQKEPSKKRKVAQTGVEIEDLMVAMAMSRSMQEENTTPNSLKAHPSREVGPPEKKSRRKKKDAPTPLLLVQAPEETEKKLQNRMSMLLSEEPTDNNHLITLPASHFWTIQKEERETWSLQAGDKCVLWDISNMMDTRDTIGYYTAELNPPITPWKPVAKKLPGFQPCTVASVTPMLSSRPTTEQKHKEKAGCPVTPGKEQTPPSDSQKDRQALLDLAELAGEGMTLTQWSCVPGNANSQTGRESPAAITCSGFIPSDQEETRMKSQVSKTNNSETSTLTADFLEMVNNPHLSDVELQTDCGEVFNVHMFVLYARCPLLVEAVHTEGFWVDEASTGRMKRLLLSDVSAEAALCFLRFLYSAKTDFPSHCLPHVCELARRFGVKSLIDTCEDLVGHPDRSEEDIAPTEEEVDDGEERADNFQELLKSMWVDEDKDLFAELSAEGLEEEEHVDDGCVGEVDLEEIYEFAATQRRMPQDTGIKCGSSNALKGRSKEKAFEANSPSPRRPAAGKREEFMATNNQQSAEEHTHIYMTNTSPVKLSPIQMNMTGSHLGKSPASPYSSSVESSPLSSAQPRTQLSPLNSVSPVKSPKEPHLSSPDLPKHQQSAVHFVSPVKSPAVSLSSSPAQSRSQPFLDHSGSPVKSPTPFSSSSRSRTHLTPIHTVSPVKSSALRPSCSLSWSRIQPPPSHSVSPVKSPSGKNFVIGKTPAHQLFTSEQSKPSESSSHVLDEHSVSVIDTISLISPERDDEPEPDLFSHHSPPPFEDSYDRMFSETCGEYVEPSGLRETNSRMLATSSRRGQPILTSSPSAIQQPDLPELGSSPNIQPTRPFLEQSSSSVANNRKTPPSSSSMSKSIQKSSTPSSTALSQDVILILSSDEEAEDSPRIANAKVQSDRSGMFTNIKDPAASFSCLNSSSEMSWLVPATPMPHVITAGVSQAQPSRISQSPETPKSRTAGGSQKSFVSPTQADSSTAVSSNRTTTSFSVKQPLLSNTPERLAKSCFSTDRKVSSARSVPTSPRSRGNSCLKQPLYSNTPEKHTEACFSTGSNTSCVPSSSQSSIASNNVFVKQPLFPNTPKKHAEARTSTDSKVSLVLSSPPSSIASNNVFEVLDSEEEGLAAEPPADTSVCSFQMDYDEPPIPVEDDLWLCEEETPKRQPCSSPEHKTSLQHVDKTPSKASSCMSSLQDRGREPENKEDSPHTPRSQSSRLSCLNSKLWDEWEDEDPELPAVLPLSQRLNQAPNMQKRLKTPVSIVRKRELPPKVPITPLPGYSDMDTPVLKKELNKFGVRALPKKQMVLKLKEIFDYTHQVMSSDSEDDVPSSQPSHGNLSAAVQSPYKVRRPAITKSTSSSLPQPGRKKLMSVCAAQEPESADDQPLTASQDSTTSSVAASDISSMSHSSGTNEFETAFADEDDDEPVSASQAASKEELKAEAVRKFIEERPDLHKRILLYQPLDLAALHTELKQSGIKIAAGKLLDFLDSHCVTFTTAAARKEKSRGRRKAAKRQ